MQPHSLATITISNAKTPAQKAAVGGWAARHAPFKRGDVLPETQVPACPRVKVADLPEGFVKQKWIDQQEQNQQIASCCRHPENHEIEARKSHPDEQAPDIYIFHCTCGKRHIKFCVGQTDDKRPMWAA
jgi:hypothetical protein